MSLTDSLVTKTPDDQAEPTILIVDDLEANLLAMKKVLANEPCRLVAVRSGEAALAATLRNHFALAIVDVQMPGMDGYELAEALQSDPDTASLPIIFVTAAYGDMEHMLAGYMRGAVDYLIKPYSPEALIAKVNVFLRLARQHRQLQNVQSILERERNQFVSVLENLPVYVYVLDAGSCEVLMANREVIRLLGYDPKGKVCFRDIHESEGRCGQCLWSEGSPFDDPRMPMEYVFRDRIIQIQAQPLVWPDNRPVRVISGIDITDRVQAEKSLVKINHQLKAAIKEIQIMAHQADSANRAKSEFLANMSHELRTPLNAILGLAEALLDRVRGPLNERQQSSLRTIESSGRHLLALINDVLDLARIEAGRMEIEREWTSAREVCEASLALVQERAAAHHLSLELHLADPEARLHADPRLLKQILVNLLGNAVKFTPDGGRIRLEVEPVARQEALRFAVTDSGIGIAAEEMQRLFQPFVQLDAGLDRKHAGTGLGLALMRRLAELHGGSVAVESTLGRGSRFSVLLPVGSAPSGTAPGESEQDSSAAPVRQGVPVAGAQPSDESSKECMRILLAEDNEANIEAVRSYLEDLGFEVAVARDGLETLRLAEISPPDVVIMDIQMPNLDGLEATRRLREMPEFSRLPIIALTALAMPGDRERCLEAGADIYLSKPVGMKHLVDTLHRLCLRGRDNPLPESNP